MRVGSLPLQDAMPEDEFAAHKESLRLVKLRKDQSLGEEADRHWEQIWDQR